MKSWSSPCSSKFINYPKSNFTLVHITFNQNMIQNDIKCIRLGFGRRQWNPLEKGKLLLVHGDFLKILNHPSTDLLISNSVS